MEHAQGASTDSWFSRNWKWLLPLVIILPIFTCACCPAIPITMAFSLIKSSDPYQHSLEAAQSSDALQGTLGTPIDAGFLVTGNVNISGDSGTAELSYTVTGPDDSAAIYVSGDKQAGQWTYRRLEAVVTSDGQTIPLQ